MPTLTLIRGLPGSGKSTLARALCAKTGAVHVEADMYFVNEAGVYVFSLSGLGRAHQWCQATVREHLAAGQDVVVSNTFVRRKEVRPYLSIARDTGAAVDIQVATGAYANIHGVPEEVVERMRTQWEDVQP